MFNHCADYERLFERYNEAMAETYNELLFQEAMPGSGGKEGFAKLEKQVLAKMDRWLATTRIDLLQGKTFADYLDSVTDNAVAFDLIMHAAYICDDGIPSAVIKHLRRHKDQVAISIVAYLLQVDWSVAVSEDEAIDDDILRVSALFSVLNQWDCDDVFDVLLQKYESYTRPYDIVSDAFRQYMRKLGPKIIPVLSESLENKIKDLSDLDGSGIALLMTLTDLAAGSGNEDALVCATTCYDAMQDKVVGAICLADLQDPRAIEHLRDWIEDHEVFGIQPDLLREIIAALQKLGDDTKDLEEKFDLGA